GTGSSPVRAAARVGEVARAARRATEGAGVLRSASGRCAARAAFHRQSRRFAPGLQHHCPPRRRAAARRHPSHPRCARTGGERGRPIRAGAWTGGERGRPIRAGARTGGERGSGRERSGEEWRNRLLPRPRGSAGGGGGARRKARDGGGMCPLLGERSVRDAIRVPPPEPSLRSRPPALMPSPSPRCRASPPLPSALRADGRGAWFPPSSSWRGREGAWPLHPRRRADGRGARSIDPRWPQPSLTTLRSVPTPVISISATSPGFMNSGGVRAAPTPPGVPVTITSPPSSGTKVEM
ncbi:MAG: hypothetical protein RLZZ276_3571, partial [Pseudomonadota bacterium]